MDLDDVLDFRQFPTASTIYFCFELVPLFVQFHVHGSVAYDLVHVLVICSALMLLVINFYSYLGPAVLLVPAWLKH